MQTLKAQQDLPVDVVRQGTAPKLNPNSGTLDYEVGKHADTSEAYLRLVSNSSGGHFSLEWIPISSVVASLGNSIPEDTAFNSSLLKAAFQFGKSTNNASFLAAVLRQEGLFKAHEKNKFQHYAVGDLSQWGKRILSNRGKKRAPVTDKTS